MLEQMPVSAVTLSELSRRVGLAKSNVLRYFESREDILLELLIRSSRAWVDELDRLAGDAVDPTSPVADRTEEFASVFATSAAGHPELLDLVAAQAGVLERNVSVDAVLGFKRAARDVLAGASTVLEGAIPELGDAAPSVCALAVTLAGALYVQAEQSAACAIAYELDPSLTPLRVELLPDLHSAVATAIAGTLARADR